METETPAYGLWALVILNTGVFVLFTLSFARPQTKRDWCSLRRCMVKLTLDGEPVLMSIIANPVVLRFVMERGLTVVRVIPESEISDLL